MPLDTRQSPSVDRGLAFTGAGLFVVGTVGSAALARLGTESTGFFRERIANAGAYRLSGLLGVATAFAVLLMIAAAHRWVSSPVRWTVAAVASGASVSLLLLAAAVRAVAPSYAFDTREAYGQGMASIMAAATTAGLMALGVMVLATPGPPGTTRSLGRAAGAVLLGGQLIVIAASAADQGWGFGLSIVFGLLSTLLVVAWAAALGSHARGATAPES